jgi:glycosyltransferase involved in cell wall biosynthesis
MKDLAPKVSVVMAINRKDQYLKQAIESILTQQFQDFELIIIVDASAPQLKDALTSEYASYGRVRVIESPSLGGLALALNLGIGNARGEYIARMDGDDVSLPLRLAKQVRFLDEHPNTGVVGCQGMFIGPDSEDLQQWYPFYGSNESIRRILPFRNPMLHPALTFRKTTLYEVGGYKYGHSSEDYELMLRIARNPTVEFANLGELLFQYRRHGNQGTNEAYFKRRFPEMAGFLFTEFLRTCSPFYLAGMVAIHPWARRLRLAFSSRS